MKMIKKRFTSVIGKKFDKDGNVQPFPGNSIISFIGPQMKQFQLLIDVQNRLKGKDFSSCFSFLPVESFHMTVFDLLCDQVRVEEHWSKFIPKDHSFEKVEHEIIKLLKEETFKIKFKMKFHHFELEKTIGAILIPEDDETGTLLRNYRDRLSEITGIRHPNHDEYFFHISMAYLIYELNDEQRKELKSVVNGIDESMHNEFETLELKPPELVFFPDMFSFPTKPFFQKK